MLKTSQRIAIRNRNPDNQDVADLLEDIDSIIKLWADSEWVIDALRQDYPDKVAQAFVHRQQLNELFNPGIYDNP